LTPENIKTLMALMAGYAGFSAAINGTNTLKEVMNDGK